MTRTAHLAEVPLGAVLDRRLTEAANARILAAGERLDALPSVGKRFGWSFRDDPAAPGATSSGRTGLLSTIVTAWQATDDWLELGLDVSVGEHPQTLMVTADVGVACMCSTNHNMHYVHSIEWLVGPDDALADAFEDAADAITRWSHETVDAERWRQRAGLAGTGA